jgi:hypothetical protein
MAGEKVKAEVVTCWMRLVRAVAVLLPMAFALGCASGQKNYLASAPRAPEAPAGGAAAPLLPAPEAAATASCQAPATGSSSGPGPASETPAAEEAKDWSVTLDTTVNGKYISRGLLVVNHPVFQPSVTATYKDFTLNVWGNVNLVSDSTGRSGQFNEVDYTGYYSWTSHDVNWSAGVIHYTFPHTKSPLTTELYGSAGLDTYLAPTLTLYQDVQAVKGEYATLGLSHTFKDAWQPARDVSMGVNLSESVGFGSARFNAFNYNTNKAAFTDLLLGLGLPFQVGEGWTVTPAAHFSTLLDSRIRRNMGHDTNVWGGLSLTRTF